MTEFLTEPFIFSFFMSIKYLDRIGKNHCCVIMAQSHFHLFTSYNSLYLIIHISIARVFVMFNETSFPPTHSNFIQMSGHDVSLTETLETVTSVLNFD